MQETNSLVPIEGEVENTVTIEKEQIDYDTYQLSRGQYWVRHDRTVIAFVLETNEFGILYQNKVNISDDDAVFDFEAGQEVSTIEYFRTYLKTHRAYLIYPQAHLITLAVDAYRRKLAGRMIFNPKALPRNEDEYNELSEYERYTQTLRILPPPIRYRKRKGYHWLKAGMAGKQFVCKLWDPEIIPYGNWILPNGELDLTASLGFVNGYYGPAELNDKDDRTETFSELKARLVEFLRKKGFMFDQKFINEQMDRFDLFNKTENSISGYINGTINQVTKMVTYPYYEIYFVILGTALVINMVYDHKLCHSLEFNNLQNKEFIPNQSVDLICYL